MSPVWWSGSCRHLLAAIKPGQVVGHRALDEGERASGEQRILVADREEVVDAQVPVAQGEACGRGQSARRREVDDRWEAVGADRPRPAEGDRDRVEGRSQLSGGREVEGGA